MAQVVIKNIIFDFGGVFLNVDYAKTRQAFIDAGVVNFDDFYQQSHISPLFTQLEKGLIEPSVFYSSLRRQANTQLTDEQIETAWDAMLGTFRESSVKFLQQLQDKYKLYLLSNANAIHYEAFMQTYKDQFGKNDFESMFEGAYFSHLVHLQKPHADSYNYILEKHKLDASETLFVDDTFKNIEGAKAVGLQTLFLENGDYVEDKIGKFIDLKA